MDDEIWKDVPSYEGYYKVSNFGRIKSIQRPWRKRERILKPCTGTKGYNQVTLAKHGGRKLINIASLVAAAFLGPRPNGLEICHNNGVRLDDRPENLRYDTRKANHADKRLHGTNRCGEKINFTKLTESDVRKIREDTRRYRIIAADYGLHKGTICSIRNKKSWAYLD